MTSCLRTPLDVSSDGVSDVTKESQSSTEVVIFGTGLQNEIGEYNCFLNVIIQVTFILINCLMSQLSLSSVYHIKLKRFYI